MTEIINGPEAMAAMLRYRRPNRSKTERKFIQRFITPLGGVEHDRFGNRIKRIGDAPILYSCHTDSVHRKPGIQELAIRGMSFKLPLKSDSNCLGADNAAGVWIMREMILAKKPGIYVFHRAEESGGQGSRFIAKNTPELLNGVKAAIAFDRRKTKSIITHQWGGRCCSNAFAESLAQELQLGHKGDSGGTFTDTANYTDLVPECTNVSIGFDHEHSSFETLDMRYLTDLRDAIIGYDWEKLVISRKAGDKEPRYSYYGGWTPKSEDWGGKSNGYRYRWRDGIREVWDDDMMDWIPEHHKPFKRGTYDYDKKSNVLTYRKNLPAPKQLGFLPEKKEEPDLLPDGHELEEEVSTYRQGLNRTIMIRTIRLNPSVVQELLEDYGITLDELTDHVKAANGIVPNEYYET